MNILAVDPGLATGVAELHDGEVLTEIVTFEEIYEIMNDLIDYWMTGNLDAERTLPDVIVCEDYIITQQTIQKSRQNYSLELIGTLRFICDRLDIKFVLQTPSQAKSFATDEKLKKLGWYKPGQGHDNDAARHLLVYAVNNGVIKPEELI